MCLISTLIPSKKLPRDNLRQKKLLNFSKLPLLDDKIDRKTNFAKLSFKN